MKKLYKIGIILLALVSVLSVAAFTFIFYNIKYVDYQYTGEELFQEVNAYRSHIGVQTLELDQLLCNNLVERWWAIKEPGNPHKGLEEWFDDNGITDNQKYGVYGEMYVKNVSTPANAIR
jgi:hypothetical protein